MGVSYALVIEDHSLWGVYSWRTLILVSSWERLSKRAVSIDLVNDDFEIVRRVVMSLRFMGVDFRLARNDNLSFWDLNSILWGSLFDCVPNNSNRI